MVETSPQLSPGSEPEGMTSFVSFAVSLGLYDAVCSPMLPNVPNVLQLTLEVFTEQLEVTSNASCLQVLSTGFGVNEVYSSPWHTFYFVCVVI